jgi:hypothetical protein
MITVQPVGRRASVKWPTSTPATFVMDPAEFRELFMNQMLTLRRPTNSLALTPDTQLNDAGLSDRGFSKENPCCVHFAGY